MAAGEIEGLLVCKQRNNHKYDVDTDHRGDSLHYTYDNSLTAGSAQLGELEFVSDRESDEAQGNRGDYLHILNILERVEPESADSETTETVRPYQKAGHEKSSDIREVQMKDLEQTRHHKTCGHGYS